MLTFTGYAVNLQYEYLKNEIPDILSKLNELFYLFL